MSVWSKYTKEQRDEYIQFLQVYGALSNLFRQKQGDLIPYLDSKFQETVFAKIFNLTLFKMFCLLNILRKNAALKVVIAGWLSCKPLCKKVAHLDQYFDL